MPRTAILFTGQGAQAVGMGKDIAAVSPAAAAVFDRANRIVGYDLKTLCFEGPTEKLDQTDIQQPAIFTTSAAIWQALADGHPPPLGEDRVPCLPSVGCLGEAPVAMAGLSLGEYTARFAAGALSFEDALRLVKRRGELMQSAARAVASGMVTALGLAPDKVEAVCREASAAGVIGPANFNCPGQVVLSGEKAACEAAAKLIEAAGGRAVPLKVAGAFHSALMKPAANGLSQTLNATPFAPPRVPVVANVNCQYHADPDSIRRWLTDQLTRPVLWQGCVERMLSDGVERFVEIGPGRTLTGLLKKISRQMPVVNVSTAESLAALKAQRNWAGMEKQKVQS